jgi:hypothetical protein
MMSDTLRKRGRDSEAQPDSIDDREPKRFHGEETDRFLHLLQLDPTLAEDQEEEECAPSEELVNVVMKSLEEEIAATSSTSYRSSNSGNNSATCDISSNREGQTLDTDSGIDLCYLLEASDDELGIPPSPVLDLKEQICLSPKEASKGLSESTDLKSLGENWHFEDDFEIYQQLPVYENAWDASQLQDCMNRDFVSQYMLFEGDFSEAWRLETAGGM